MTPQCVLTYLTLTSLLRIHTQTYSEYNSVKVISAAVLLKKQLFKDLKSPWE